MPDSSRADFYCDLVAIEDMSKYYSKKIEEFQAIFTKLNASVESVASCKLLEGTYFDAFLENYDQIREAYYRVQATMMVLNMSLGNVQMLMQPLIEARDCLIDYL